MKVGELQQIIKSVEQIYRDGGNVQAADSLKEITKLFAGHDTMTVPSFAKIIASASLAAGVG
jgi:hypothetical protein